MKIYDEIKKVGFADWVWWVFYCERNEFHPRLDINVDKYFALDKVGREKLALKIAIDRSRAHRIDMEIG